MKKTADKPAFKIAFCAVIAALEAALMMLGSLFPAGTYAVPVFAGLLSVAVVIEFGCKWAFGVFAVTSLISFFLAGDKESVLFFIAIFGYYPILKNIIERKIKLKAAQYILKFAVFNIAAVGAFFAGTALLAIPAEEYTLFGVYVPFVFLILGNIFFLLYDMAIGVFVRLYVQRLRKILTGRFL